MSQINVNPSGSGDRSGAAAINMITVIIVLAVLLVVGWWLFTAGPLAGGGARDVNVNVNVPKVEQPAAPNNPAPKTNP
jgi:hypothetical protein